METVQTGSQRLEEGVAGLSHVGLRRIRGPLGTEVFIHCAPRTVEAADIARQTEEVYGTLEASLELEGGSLEHVVQETVFFRDIRQDMHAYSGSKRRFLHDRGSFYSYRPASMFIDAPPVAAGHQLEITASAIIPRYRGAASAWNLWNTPACGCEDCPEVTSRVVLLGGQRYLFAGNVVGTPGTPFDEACGMFLAAEGVLRQEGLDFHSVLRTWIYLRHMDEDYAEFNRARRAFFKRAGVEVRPASTGIGGFPFAEDHRFTMSFYAAHSPLGVDARVMTTPSLNEAHEYGSEFSRGMRIVEANKVSLHISGTASLDEGGCTVHRGSFHDQVDRMLLNVSTLLEKQGASFADVLSAVTYLKNPADTPRLRGILLDRGINGFPNVVVEANVCRPELLCEMEAVAALPLCDGAG